MRIRMRNHITGTRRGHPWPSPGGEIDVRESEADMLVRQRMADYVSEHSAPVSVSENESEPESESEQVATPVPSRLSRKSAWIDYAEQQGMERANASALTKAQLIERFGE